jgi:hypothetical protein
VKLLRRYDFCSVIATPEKFFDALWLDWLSWLDPNKAEWSAHRYRRHGQKSFAAPIVAPESHQLNLSATA